MNQVATIKVGGASGVDIEHVCRDVASLVNVGWRVAIVHGGSHEIDDLAQRCGSPTRTLSFASGYSSRRTDAAALELVIAAMAGTVNTRIVQVLSKNGISAIGLTGLDAKLLRARRKALLKTREGDRVRIVRDDFSGQIEHVDAGVLAKIFAAGWVPVIAPVSPTEAGEIVNVDADRVAAAIAIATGSAALVLLSNVPGVLRDVSDASSLIRRLVGREVAELREGTSGRMKAKVAAAEQALTGGVQAVIIADGRQTAPISGALFHGQGTRFCGSEPVNSGSSGAV